MERYYKILDLPPTATEQEVKQAYRELVKVWHPDRFTHDLKLQRRAEEKLKEINDAYHQIVAYLNNSYARQRSQYQKTEKKEKHASQSPPKQPYSTWICPECLRTNYLDSPSCGCGFKTNASEINTYKTDQTSADLYEAILFNRSMNYMDRAAFLARYLLIRFPNSKEADVIKLRSQGTTSSGQPKPTNHRGICGRCGQERATFRGEFRENISYFFERKERTIDAELCFPCTARVFIELTGRTFLLTWWGIIGAIVGPIYIVSNISWFFFNTFRFMRQGMKGGMQDANQENSFHKKAPSSYKSRNFLHRKVSPWCVIPGSIIFTVLLFGLILSFVDTRPSKEKHAEILQPTKISDHIVEPSFRQPIQPLPINGTIKRYVDNEAVAPFRIITRGSGNHYFVKIADWYTNKVICTVFIRTGQEVSFHVPLGSYKLKYATGENWYGTKYLFGPDTVYSVADNQFDFEVRGERISGYTVELFLQPNGNLKTNRISAEEF